MMNLGVELPGAAVLALVKDLEERVCRAVFVAHSKSFLTLC